MNEVMLREIAGEIAGIIMVGCSGMMILQGILGFLILSEIRKLAPGEQK